MISRVSGKKAEISVVRKLNWSTALIISSELHKINNTGIRRITINFKSLEEADEKGVLPLVAICDLNRKLGCVIHFVWPRDHNLRAVFRNHHWSAYLSGDEPEVKKRLTRTTGLVKFDSHQDLNDKMNEAIAVCIKGTVFNRETLRSFEWAFSEILDNVLIHSQAGCGYFEVTWGMNGRVSFTVCDSGVGIPKHIRNAFKEVNSDHDAIAKAVEKGITSTREGQGNGLAGTLNIINSALGTLTINSGFGSLSIQQKEMSSKAQKIPFKGTFVNFTLPIDTQVDIQEALWGFETYSFTDYSFNDTNDDKIVLKLTDHGKRFGNRPTGRDLRNTLLNLLSQHPEIRINVDFEGIEIISSSFGDEFLGKLVAEKGVIYFSQAIKLSNLSVIVGNILNNVIAQRLYQDYARDKKLPLHIAAE